MSERKSSESGELEEAAGAVLGRLMIVHPDEHQEDVALNDGAMLRIGRLDDNDIVLPYSKISRYHSMMHVSRESVVITDLDSMNGTFVNNKRITIPVALNDGDEIRFAEVRARYSRTGAAVPESASPRAIESGVHEFYVSVLFADICGYRKMADAVPARDLADTLQRWLNGVENTIRSNGGHVGKFLGDGILGVWREPVTEGKDGRAQAVNCVDAAQEILALTGQISASRYWPHREQLPWRCKVSANSGKAHLDSFGIGDAQDYSLSGEIVDLAYRLNESFAELNCELILSEEVRNLISDQRKVTKLKKLKLEGAGQAIQVYTIG